MWWLYIGALMESGLLAVDLVRRHTGSWSYIQGSTCNRVNDGETDIVGWMLHSVYAISGVYCTRCMLNLVYAVLGVCWTRCMLYSVYAVLGVCCTRCMLYSVYAVLGVCCTRCMLYSVYAVLGVCCTRCMLYLAYAVLGVCCTRRMRYSACAVLGVNSWSWNGEIESDDSTSCSEVMVDLRTRKREMRGDGGNNHEKLGLNKISCASQFTIDDTAGTSPDSTCTYNDTRTSQSNQVSRTPDFSYPLVSSTSFSSSSPISLFLVHNSNIITEHKVKLFLSISPCHDDELTPSTQDCLSFFHSHVYELTPECSFSFWRTSVHDQQPSASSPWELHGEVTLSLSDSCELTNWRRESQHTVYHPSTASNYLSKLLPWWPPSLLDHGLQVFIQTRPCMAYKCIPKLAWSRPPSVSTKSLDYGLQVRTITASKCISKLARWQSSSVSENFQDYGLQVCTITASKCISKLARLRPRGYISEFTQSSSSGAPRIALKYRLQPI